VRADLATVGTDLCCIISCLKHDEELGKDNAKLIKGLLQRLNEFTKATTDYYRRERGITLD